jgi:hypothetical protein
VKEDQQRLIGGQAKRKIAEPVFSAQVHRIETGISIELTFYIPGHFLGHFAGYIDIEELEAFQDPGSDPAGPSL